MKVYFNRQVVRSPWGGGAHFMSAMVDFLVAQGHQVAEWLEPGIDIIFLMDPRFEAGGTDLNQVLAYRRKYPKTKIIHRVNECDARKGTTGMDAQLMLAAHNADRVVFISQWLKDHFAASFNKPADVVYNGCNTEWFKPNADKKLGSKIKVVTHHWSDNFMKGFDIYNELDKLAGRRDCKFEFTYIGRYNKDYWPQSTWLLPPMYGPDLGDELRKHDVYVTASRWEPCGMHHIEGAASGMPVLYHRDGGGIPEGCAPHGLPFSNIPEFLSALDTIVASYDTYRSCINHSYLSIERCCRQYYQIMQEMIS